MSDNLRSNDALLLKMAERRRDARLALRLYREAVEEALAAGITRTEMSHFTLPVVTQEESQ